MSNWNSDIYNANTLTGLGGTASGYTPWLQSNQITPEMYNSFTDIERAGIADSYKNLANDGTLKSTIADGLGASTNNSMFGKMGDFLGSNAFKNITGLGNLALGFMEYGDKKEMNDQTLEGMRFNLAQSKKEAAVDDAYRKSYGA